MNCSNLDIIFPTQVTGTIDTASSIILNGIPTLATFSLYIIFLLIRQPTKYVIPVYFSVFLGVLCIAVVDLLLWRMFDIMECKQTLDMIPYKFLTIIIFPIVTLVLLFAAYYRNYNKLTSFICILIAGGVVGVDYSIRKFSIMDAAQPIFPAQTFTCSLALCCLFCGKYKIKQMGGKCDSNNNTLSSNKEYCSQPHFMDPTSRHPIESKGVGSAPEFRSVWA